MVFESRPRNDTLELLVTRVTFIVDLTFSLEIVSCYSCFVELYRVIGIQSMMLYLISIQTWIYRDTTLGNEFNWIHIGNSCSAKIEFDHVFV